MANKAEKTKYYDFAKDAKDPKRMKKATAQADKKMSGGMAMGGGHKNYKMTGTLKAKTGKLVGNQKKLPKHLQKAILA
jgi:hypothetical protein